MAYATLDDVQRRMPQVPLNATSRPTLESAQVFLDDVHAHFDAAIENLGYRVPLVGVKSINQAREIVSQGAIARILYSRGAGVGTDAAFQSADRAQKQYDDALKNLADPHHPMELVDAVRTDDQIAKPGIEPMGRIYDDDGERLEPRISMDTKF